MLYYVEGSVIRMCFSWVSEKIRMYVIAVCALWRKPLLESLPSGLGDLTPTATSLTGHYRVSAL